MSCLYNNARNPLMIYRIPLFNNFSCFVPKHLPATEADIRKLRDFFLTHQTDILVLTGAGISTESGLPDYRSAGVGLYATSNNKPMTYQEFTRNAYARKRYWARSYIAWPKFSSALPGPTHEILAKLEKKGFLKCIVTQNVDNLHYKANCKNVIELHGSLYRVICINCSEYHIDRNSFQIKLEQLNPMMTKTTNLVRPDGDVDFNDDDVNSFVIPSCLNCNGYLKPDVVFFGENIPMKRVDEVKREIEKCSSVLVLGSSLSTYSSFRIILQAVDLGKPVCIVNIGETRGDNLAFIKLQTKCGQILPAACASLL